MTEVQVDEPAAMDLSDMSSEKGIRILERLQEAKDELRERAEVDPSEYVIQNEDVVVLIASEPDDKVVRVVRIARLED